MAGKTSGQNLDSLDADAKFGVCIRKLSCLVPQVPLLPDGHGLLNSALVDFEVMQHLPKFHQRTDITPNREELTQIT
jgi:hypothetical protein